MAEVGITLSSAAMHMSILLTGATGGVHNQVSLAVIAMLLPLKHLCLPHYHMLLIPTPQHVIQVSWLLARGER